MIYYKFISLLYPRYIIILSELFWRAPELIAIQTVLSQTPGVFGSRFSGAGWGGCCLALVDGDQAATVRRVVEKQLTRLPGLNAARVFFVSSEDGLRVVSAS